MAWSLLAALSLAAAVSGSAPETSAERLHRKGVYCMEVIERADCAIEHFEALLSETTRERELLTDGLLRLLQLYRREGRDDAVGPLLRQFWDAGGGRRSAGHVPYSARFVPERFDMLVNLDPPRLLDSALLERGGDPLRDTVFTCDDVRRHDIEVEKRWARAKAQAQGEGRETWDVFYAQLDEDRARREAYEQRREARETGSREPEPPTPLMFALACPLVEALALTDNRDWRRVTGISDHRALGDAVAIFQLDDLEPRLTAAVAAGRLSSPRPGRWVLPPRDDDDGLDVEAFELAVLDHGELVAGPPAVLAAMEQAKTKRKPPIDRELDRLVGQVPRDTVAFAVLTRDALRDLGFGGMERKGMRRVLETILPRPKGLQIAVVAGSSLALFTRLPTDTAGRGRMLVSLANTMLARRAADDPETAEMIANLDVAEASDRKALLASYVITAARLETILWGD